MQRSEARQSYKKHSNRKDGKTQRKIRLLLTRRLSDLGNRGENSAGRGQILSILQVNSRSIDQESGEIWSVQTDLQ